MARSQCKYDHEYKVQAVKLAKEIGGAKAAKELGIPEGTIHTWLSAARTGKLDIGAGSHTPESAMSLAEELAVLRSPVPSAVPWSHPAHPQPRCSRWKPFCHPGAAVPRIQCPY